MTCRYREPGRRRQTAQEEEQSRSVGKKRYYREAAHQVPRADANTIIFLTAENVEFAEGN